MRDFCIYNPFAPKNVIKSGRKPVTYSFTSPQKQLYISIKIFSFSY